jgi:hypothetical protein
LLKFQWLRPHPATAIACLSDTDEELPSSVKQLARSFSTYSVASPERASGDSTTLGFKKGTGEHFHYQPENDKSQSTPNNNLDHPLVQATGVKLDLCDYLLPDPPMLSNVTGIILDVMQKGKENPDEDEEIQDQGAFGRE